MPSSEDNNGMKAKNQQSSGSPMQTFHLMLMKLGSELSAASEQGEIKCFIGQTRESSAASEQKSNVL